MVPFSVTDAADCNNGDDCCSSATTGDGIDETHFRSDRWHYSISSAAGLVSVVGDCSSVADVLLGNGRATVECDPAADENRAVVT